MIFNRNALDHENLIIKGLLHICRWLFHKGNLGYESYVIKYQFSCQSSKLLNVVAFMPQYVRQLFLKNYPTCCGNDVPQFCRN